VVDVILFGWCAGTAASCARAISANGARVVSVVSRGDADRGPLAAACAEIDAPLWCAADASAPALSEHAVSLRADMLLVAGWPRRLGDELLQATRLGAINVHPSLLPRYRAREPVFWTVLAGDRQSGVTLHRMTGRIDCGPVLLQRALPVRPRATSAALGAELDALAADLTADLCAMACRPPLLEGSSQRGEPSHFPPLRAEHGALRWSEPATALDRRVRACAGMLEARAGHRGMKLVVLEADVAPAESAGAPPGTVIEVRDDALVVASGDGTALAVWRFGFLGRVMHAGELAAALELRPGARLDDG
jgi:UDP-4-amino-4-deoxy-L-arabinose formyltransferase/UDP-glucuronic acid dehydrogenase (UDP-4-keto-hexauronic acid decarboxylating)